VIEKRGGGGVGWGGGALAAHTKCTTSIEA